MGWWGSATKTPAESWFFSRIGGTATEPAEIPPDTFYLNAFLRSMRVSNTRVGTISYRGSVTSSFSLPTRGGSVAELLVVAGPKVLNKIDPNNQDKVITLNTRLLGPIPYRGGDVTVELGLFSIPQSDLVEPYLTVLEQLSTLAGVSFVAPAMPIVNTVKTALNLLVGAKNDTQLEIGVSTTLTPLEPGDYCAIKAPREFATGEELSVAADGRLIGQDKQEITHPYLVFTLSTAEQRADWYLVPEVRLAYEEIKEAARRGDLQRAQEGERAFRRIAVTCDDLLSADAVRLSELVDKEISHAFAESVLTSATEDTHEMPDLRVLPLYGEA